MDGILTVMLFTAVVVPNHAIYPGFLPYAPPAVPFPYVPFQRSLPARPLFAYSIHTAVPPNVPASVPASVPPRAAASEVRSFYSSTDNSYQGYSYQTQYEDGGKSEVVFAVGPEAEQIMKKSLEFFDSIIPKDFGRQFNTNETDSTNGSSSAVPRISPNSAFTLLNPNPFFPDTITSFVNTIVTDNAKATQVSEETQESMVHGDITASPSPNKEAESVSNSDESIDSRSSASESSTTIDSTNSIIVSESNGISTIATTTAAENIDNSDVAVTTTVVMPTTTISATMMPSTTTASSTIFQTSATNTPSSVTEDENNDITRTTEASTSTESSPDSATTIVTSTTSGSETTTEGTTETTTA